jgi:predicted peptidase
MPNLKSFLLFCLCSFLISSAWAERAPEDDERLINDPRVQHRSYVFEPTGESLPYAVFVPSTYRADSSSPLIIALHGLGRSYDWLMGYEGFLDYAEASGMIVATPLGYIRRGWYGSRATPDAVDASYSEADVMAVLDLMREEFSVDENRIYLYGHSMGGAGTYHIATKNPYVFAALAVAAPAPRTDLAPDGLAAIRHIPTLVLQGTADALVPVEMTRRWVREMQSIGMPHVYVEIEGADHSLFISQNRENMRKVISFFDIVRRRYPPAQ